MSEDFKVKFTQETAEAAAKQEQYAFGVYQGVVTGATKEISKAMNKVDGEPGAYPMLCVQLRPLEDAGDLNSTVGMGIRTYQCLPVENPSWAENLSEEDYERRKKNLPIYNRTGHALFHALLPDEIPAMPRIIKGKLMYNGEEIERAEREAKNKDALNLSGAVAADLWNGDRNLTDLENRLVFFEIGQDEGEDFVGVKGIWPEQPVDPKTGRVRDLVPKGQFMQSGSTADKSKNGKTAARATPTRKSVRGGTRARA